MTFQIKRTRELPILRAVATEYEDPATGARHIHLGTDDSELVFMAAFATLPGSSNGAPHILEHLTLCGSARYPVRDPFFAMTRRSLATFMNAFTYADRTCYPVASADPIDFTNLVDVYLSSVFEPTLHYLDFLQEGWRYELVDGRLTYAGIVLNEMKGAYIDPSRALDAAIGEHILAGTTYAVDSGGDPAVIPSLQHDDLKAFHRTHYHPSRAIFMSAGKVDVAWLQDTIATRVLAKCSERLDPLLPQPVAPWDAPRQVEIAVPRSEGGRNEYGVQIAWRLEETGDLYAAYRNHLLESGLIGDSSAPLLRALESSAFGRPSAMNGLDMSAQQMIYHAGMEGLTKQQTTKARKRMWSALEEAAEKGAPHTTLEATLRDIRFQKREVGGERIPHGLRVLLEVLPVGVYGGDMMAALDVEPVLKRLEDDIKDPAFYKNMVRSLIASNSRLDAAVIPDPDYFSSRQKAEDDVLSQCQANLTEADRQTILDDMAALQARQRSVDDKSVLPRIRPEQVTRSIVPSIPVLPDPDGHIALLADTNGIGYASVAFDVSAFSRDDWCWLKLYASIVPELGLANMGFEEASAWRQDKAPEFKVNLESLQHVDNRHAIGLSLSFCAKGLQEQHAALTEMLSASVASARFDEIERLAYLIEADFKDIESNLAEDGDRYASSSVSSALSSLGYFDDAISGASCLSFYKELYRQSQSKTGIKHIATRLADLHQRITSAPGRIVTVGGKMFCEPVQEDLKAVINTPHRSDALSASIEFAKARQLALHAPSQINHCFAAWAVPTLVDAQAPAFAVLAELLTNEYLHRVLREEGGAYGGGASYNNLVGIFHMRSYRDPKIEQTFDAFGAALEWVVQAEIVQESLEEAIISVIQEMDKPLPPYGEAVRSLKRQERGVTDELRQAYRTGVLACTVDQLKGAAQLLRQAAPNRAAFAGNPDAVPAGFVLMDLPALLN